MAIPPFPSQDLAKLVLGYLVEEQLMTAYDEFLQESPYLDAQKNEYDRILLHSLRDILAEYRAVKIYVEGCKPIALRRKLFQCTNLYEKVKFLVQNIDVNKLHSDVSKEKLSFESQDISTSKSACDTCNSLRQGNCVCIHRKKNISTSKSGSNVESIDDVENLAQTTSLSDLPGNQVHLENRHSRVTERHTNTIQTSSDEVLTVGSPCKNNVNIEQNSISASLHTQSNPDNLMSSSTIHKSNIPGNGTSLQCSQNIAEFNTVLNQVYNNGMVTGGMRDSTNMICHEDSISKISTAGTFQDFTTGVGGVAKSNINIPDSSTSESVTAQILPSMKENKSHNKRNVKVQQKKKCVYRVGNVKHDVTEISSEIIDVDSVDVPTQPKQDEQKVTILSDVRVGSDDRCVRLAPVAKNATSTPLLQMQTIFINGTPVYKQMPVEKKYTYTRDEIMAMPTIILVPSTGSSQTTTTTSITSKKLQPIVAQSSNISTSTCSVPNSYQPLNVDVSLSSSNTLNFVSDIHEVQSENVSKAGLVKTVDTKIASVPKDSVVASSSSTSTPNMLPPKRKSSSTPRRTSHVRVLDFTTPRRILDETIDENPNPEGESDSPEDVIISKSASIPIALGSVNDKSRAPVLEVKTADNRIEKLREEIKSDQKKEVRKKKDWDADLRALAVASDPMANDRVPAPKPRRHVKKVAENKDQNKKQSEMSNSDKTKKKTDAKSSATPTARMSKKKVKHTVEKKLDGNNPATKLPVIVGTSVKEKEVSTVKDKNSDNTLSESKVEEQIETPEIERLSLHNEIGVKLNISDILETPYKQALYDIQMETPKFLGPDLPDDPVSDIKIMNIPTPRFLSSNVPFTPKPAQATPSSYSSRPTDYSSGGSYYKPDDQDYLPLLEDVACPVTSTLSKENSKSISADNTRLEEGQPKEKPRKTRSSRPIRQCTKNVSYYNSPITNKNINTEKKDNVSSCSDTISTNSSFEITSPDNISTAAKNERTKLATKLANKKNLSLTRKRSPLKKGAQKSFMKIKPRRSTPTKSNKKSSATSKNTSSGKQKHRTSIKDKTDSVASLIPAPTKSRRKSSTPRKLHCTKTFNSESSGHESPEVQIKEVAQNQVQSSSGSCIQDSDNEQPPLRWSDDGSQDTKLQNTPTDSAANETDEISQIKEYIDKTLTETAVPEEIEGSFHIDLIKRGFDAETAKLIERDLSRTPSHCEVSVSVNPSTDKTPNKTLERSVESDCSTLASNLVINEEADAEDVEFSVHECNEESANYLTIQYVESDKPPISEVPTLKDKFSMEICIDDGLTVRLRATPFNYLFSNEPNETGKFIESNEETELAVSSISNMERLYTPLKDPIRAQCYDIFDSTLTSIDTPLKTNSPRCQEECTETDILLEVENSDEKLEEREKSGKRKRKRSYCSSASEDSVSGGKKVKPETQYILHSKEIKNLDIETVLSRLHGP